MSNKIPQAFLDLKFRMLLCPKCVKSELEEAEFPSKKSQFKPVYDLTPHLGDDETQLSFGKVSCDLCGEKIK